MYLKNKQRKALQIAIDYLEMSYGHGGDPEEQAVLDTLYEMLRSASESARANGKTKGENK